MTATFEQLDRLQKLQNTACRLILQADARTHISEMHADLGLTSLAVRRHFHLAIFMYKVVNGLIISLQLAHLFESIHLRHDIPTRAQSRNDMLVPRSRTLVGARAISIVGPNCWNGLSEDTRVANTVNTFKNRYWREQDIQYV